MTTTVRAMKRRSARLSIERGLNRMTMDQSSRIRRMRLRMEKLDQAPIYDAAATKSIRRAMAKF